MLDGILRFSIAHRMAVMLAEPVHRCFVSGRILEFAVDVGEISSDLGFQLSSIAHQGNEFRRKVWGGGGIRSGRTDSAWSCQRWGCVAALPTEPPVPDAGG